ncbi:MAG: TolC family protein [Burkholderiales bacterium]|nr:TolC family protein [Burkholderiales bacterium]
MKIVTKQYLVLSIGGVIASLLGGCGLMGPTYQKPNIDTPDHFRSITASVQVESGVNLSDVSWWTKFNDPTLNQLIDDALMHNNNIQMAIGNIAVAQAQLKRVHMGWVPTLSAGGFAGVGQVFNYNSGITDPQLSSIAPNDPNANFNFYGAGLVPNYSLNIFNLIKKADVAKANLEAQRYAKDATRLTVLSQVAGSYFTLLALNEQIVEQQQLIADLTEVVELGKIQYKHGYISLTDIQQSQEQLEQAKMQLPTLENNKTAAENALKVLTNKNPGIIVGANQLTNIKSDNIIPVSLPSSVLRNRPDIMQAEAQLKVANANIGVATSNFFPTLDITTPLGLFNTNYANLFNPSGDFWTLQIAAVMPILNAGLLELVKEKKADYYVAYYGYVQTVRLAFADVDDKFASYNAINKTALAANSFYEIAKLNQQLNQKNYKSGYSAYSDTLSSKLTVDNTRLSLTGVKLQQLQALVNLYQALAGGYNYKNTEELNKFGDARDQ